MKTEVSSLYNTTLEKIQLLDKTDQLAAMILQSEVAEHYRQCFYNMQNNHESQRKIKEFLNLKDQYEEVQRFGKYHPNYKPVKSKIREVKREMDLDPYVAAYKVAENDLQALLDEISVIIGHSVSKSIKVPTGNPYFDTLSGCGGGCGTGGSCGCSTK
ncbi:YlbF family regulator [Bacillus marasmi]|uniref:YlbF family regulator n=1 Tax=Bacillus marasmi TaxID=1926279 RepID=UPI0011C7D5E1|nr:YlbF family regulator [Bacillus marasmi]